MYMVKEKTDRTILSWKAPEYHHYKKSQWWFPVQALMTLILVTYFVLTNQLLVAIIVALGAIMIYQLAHSEPVVYPVIFSTEGIRFRDRFWAFQDLKSFWITESGRDGRVRKLYLKPIQRFTGLITIPLIHQDTGKVRGFLKKELPEAHEAGEDLADRINRWLRI